MKQQHPLLKRIAEGEHLHLDFKHSISDAKKIARSVTAFANAEGGSLLIGVKDNGNIVGVKSEEELYMVEAAADIFTKPAAQYTIKQWNISGKTVLEVQIPRSGRGPHTAPDEDGRYRVYIRKGDENRLASSLEEGVLRLSSSKNPLNLNIGPLEEKVLSAIRDANAPISLMSIAHKCHLTEKEAVDICSKMVFAKILTINGSDEICI